jgi:L-alanine-DL-glutamate epimerase-like enolase superfamily enzyme
VTLAADESLQQAPLGEPLSASLIQRRLGQALDEGVEVITLKPMFVGGLLSCATLARTALQRGARVCLTHALEGALGRRGVAHLCAALASEGLRVEGGLTGALPVDVMSPLEVSEGQVLIPDEPGLGSVNGGVQ